MGFSISDFWESTPYEFSVIQDGYADRKQQDYDLAITQAYLTAKLIWTKKLPDLKKLIGKKEPKKAMTDDQMKQMAMVLNKLYGGEVIENGN